MRHGAPRRNRRFQRLGEFLAGLETRLGGLGQRAQNGPFEGRRNVRGFRGRRRRLLLHVLDRNGEGAVAIERQRSGGGGVEHDAQAVQVAAGVDMLAAHLFGRHVFRSSHRHARLGFQRAVADAGDAKVHHHRLFAADDHNVVWLDVAMNDAFVMGVSQGAGDLGDQPRRELRAQGALGSQHLLQRYPLDIFHDDEKSAPVLVDVEDRDDVFVLQARDDLGLLLEPPAELGVSGQFAREHFDGDDSIERFLPGAINDAHAAAAQLGEDFVASVDDQWPHGGFRVFAMHRARRAPGMARRPGCASAAYGCDGL